MEITFSHLLENSNKMLTKTVANFMGLVCRFLDVDGILVKV